MKEITVDKGSINRLKIDIGAMPDIDVRYTRMNIYQDGKLYEELIPYQTADAKYAVDFIADEKYSHGDYTATLEGLANNSKFEKKIKLQVAEFRDQDIDIRLDKIKQDETLPAEMQNWK